MSDTMAEENLPLPPAWMEPLAAAAVPATAPVVTGGIAAQNQQAPAEAPLDFFAAFNRLQQIREGQRESPLGMSPEQERALDRLAAFGAALASTRSPTFQGALGEGVQALLRSGAGQRQESRQERQVDVEAAYRAAQEARQTAEAEWARDPQNPLNIARLAAARSDEIRARAALASAGRESLGSGTPIELEGGRQGLLMRDGSVRELPRNARFLRSADQEDRSEGRRAALYIQARSRAAAELGANPGFIGLPEAQQDAAIERRTQTILRSLPGYAQQPAAPTEGAAPAAGGNRVRLPGL